MLRPHYMGMRMTIGAALALFPAAIAHAVPRVSLQVPVREPSASVAATPMIFARNAFGLSRVIRAAPMDAAVLAAIALPVAAAAATENNEGRPWLLGSIVRRAYEGLFELGRQPASATEIEALSRQVWDAGGKQTNREFSTAPINRDPFFGAELPTTSLKAALGRDYRDMRDLSIAILRTHPPSEYYYVGIGRSPTPVMAMIQSILGDSAGRNIPLSDMRLMRTGSEDAEADPALFKRHMAHFLPVSAQEIGGKKILVIDWADTGATMVHLKRELSRLMGNRSLESRLAFEYLALTHEIGDVSEKLRGHGITPLVVTGKLLSIFDEHRYREFAEYDQFSIARRGGRTPSQGYEPPAPVTLAIKQRRHQEYCDSITYLGDDSERWVRRAKRALEREFLDLASYDSLKDGYRRLAMMDRWIKGLLGR